MTSNLRLPLPCLPNPDELFLLRNIQDYLDRFNILETFPNIISKRLSILSFTLSVNPFEVISMNDTGRNPGFLMVCHARKLGSLPSCCCFSNTSSWKSQRQGNHSSQKLPPKNKICYTFEDFIHDSLIIFIPSPKLLPYLPHPIPYPFCQVFGHRDKKSHRWCHPKLSPVIFLDLSSCLCRTVNKRAGSGPHRDNRAEWTISQARCRHLLPFTFV